MMITLGEVTLNPERIESYTWSVYNGGYTKTIDVTMMSGEKHRLYMDIETFRAALVNAGVELA